MRALTIGLLAACSARPAPRVEEGPAPRPPSRLSAYVALPRLGSGLSPLAALAEDLSPTPLALTDGRDAAIALAGLGPDAFDRLDPDRPAFALFFSPDDPPVYVLPVRTNAPLEAPPHGFVRVRERTALASESGELLEASAEWASRVLARSHPADLAATLLPGEGRTRARRALESAAATLARDVEASAREARAAIERPPTLGDPEALGPLAEDLLRGVLGAVGDAPLELRVVAFGGIVRIELRAPAEDAPPPGASPPPAPFVPDALVRWSSVTRVDDRLEAGRRIVEAFARIAGDRMPAAERAALAAALERFERSRGDASSGSVGPSAAAATFATGESAGETTAAAVSLASALSRGHAGRVLRAIGYSPVVAEPDGDRVRLRFGRAATGPVDPASEWPAGTAFAARVDPVRALSALAPLGGDRMAALATAANASPSVPPLRLSVRQDGAQWSASLEVPRASAREIGRVLRRGLARN